MVGGGNFVEAQAHKDMGVERGKEIIYSATDFVTPENFLKELDKIGQGGG